MWREAARDTSRGWARTSAKRCSRTGIGHWSGRGTGRSTARSPAPRSVRSLRNRRAAGGTQSDAGPANARIGCRPAMSDIKPQVYKDERPAGVLRPVPRRARKGVGWTYALVRTLVTPADAAALPDAGDRPQERAEVRARSCSPRTTSARWTTSSSASSCAGRSASWPNPSCSARPSSPTSSTHGGVFPVRRGHQDEEAFKTAFTILEQGEMLLVYAEGGRSRSGELGEVETRDRPHRARIRGAGRPGCDPWLGERAPLEAPPLPEGHRPVRRAALASRWSTTPSRERQLEAATRDLRAGARDVRGRAEAWPPPCRSGVPQWLVSRRGRSRGAGRDNLF